MSTGNTIHIIVEKTDQGFSAYAEAVPGCVTTGTSLMELKKNMREALELHKEGYKEAGEPLPDALKRPYDLELQLDVQQLFAFFHELNASAIAQRIGMNPSLIRQYITGNKRPSEKQSQRILKGVREFGQDLASIG